MTHTAIHHKQRNKMSGDSARRLADQFHLAALLSRVHGDDRAFIAAIDAALLTRIGRQLHSLAVADCNCGLTDRQQKRREKLSAQAKGIASWYDLRAECHGDPRGCVLKLHGPAMVANGWNDGFGVR